MAQESIICTLFEGNYHYGVGALVNSLYANGFRGRVIAGYRGNLPIWAPPGNGSALGGYEHQVAEGCTIHFVPLSTKIHLTNYKPRFLLDVWANHCPEASLLYYLDPDICVKCNWEFFEEWAGCGVALCEDLNSPINPTHPLRLRWERFFAAHGVKVNSDRSVFVNGGFIGVSREHLEFLREWARNMDIVSSEVGELMELRRGDRTLLFQIPDQDALNVTVYSTKIPISVLGKEGMDFIPGGYTMSHAAGREKPWTKSMLLSALAGFPPTMADKGYWKNVRAPVRLYGPWQLLMKRIALRIGAALGRLIRRS